MTLLLSGTNGVSDVDGTAATPAIRGTDTNTGIFFPAADTIAFAEGGVEVARFDASGNLGLGVTPSAWSLASLNAFQIQSASLYGYSTDESGYSQNAYYASGFFRYINSGLLASQYRQISGTHRWLTAPSGTAGNAISFTQALTLNANGNLALQGGNTSANGVGVTFPATQNASSDANTLDDYEGGSWTPVLTGIGSGTLSQQFGRYRKIGSLVFIVGKIAWSGRTGTDALNIAGLPFSAADSADTGQRASAFPEGDWEGVNDLMDLNGMFRTNGTSLQGVIDNGAGSSIIMSAGNLSAAGEFNFSMTYYV